MGIVAGGIASVLQEHFTISTSLREFRSQETIVLLSIHIGYQTLFRLEIKGHRVALILIATHFKHRCTHKLLGSGIHLTRCMHQVAVETHIDLFTRQVHVLVLHIRLSIQMSQSG